MVIKITKLYFKLLDTYPRFNWQLVIILPIKHYFEKVDV